MYVCMFTEVFAQYIGFICSKIQTMSGSCDAKHLGTTPEKICMYEYY